MVKILLVDDEIFNITTLKYIILGIKYEAFDRLDWFGNFTSIGIRPWTFSTFIGSFLHDFGRIGTLISVSLIALCTRFLIQKQKK